MKKLFTESQAIERIVGEYKRAGYEIHAEPVPSFLPKSLRPFRPDLIAHKGDEWVWIDIKSRREIASDAEISDLATQIGKLKGWHLEVQFIEPPDRGARLITNPLLEKDISTRLNSARLLLSHEDPDSALLITWSALEAILHQLTWNKDVGIEPWNGVRAAKQLTAVGELSRTDYEFVLRTAEARNQVAHGGSAGASTRSMVRSLISLALRLMRTSERSAP